ncbi:MULTISPECIES: HAD family phosphatase [unclassified Curtobacterium]|uniref:HAD family hydrolase n=1 Tax=unclassified Curtobacterium TaxID=257496 RepID=UPI000DAA32F3|nr:MULTISPECIES: beta-phosphoglucomutase family hydrolase [unclassified Curtobacterium]PZE23715.1 haloacid dehalogenase [Curtobacterium sp. MCBD17_028]PZF60028.1 haloacid dehalogenase [Curtobacterium sp. MCBD17_013]WIB63803.1 beta-phosphoglucomutase family hydrolase [Curtobacterium sp. MCBD17_040]WIB67644.1 beta-phosphoglucomutase family hydrolase [Curtobacterium sp. MCBD17_035]
MTTPSTRVPGSLAEQRALLFDLDGVLTPTADVHMRAWSRLFTPYLEQHGVAPYTEQDYYAYIDGKPRYDGVRSLLVARGIQVPEGDPSDGPDADTVCGLGNRKNAAFNAELEENGVLPYPGSARFLDAAIAAGYLVAVVSSSANARSVLRTAGILDRFPVVVDGTVAIADHLAGKPAPDTFVDAAHRLGLTPASCVVFEDALAGVQAGHAGAFGLVVGVDRGAGADALRAHGADVVVPDLADLVDDLPAPGTVTHPTDAPGKDA